MPRRAFTIVELMIVVIVLAVLCGIAIPAYATSRTHSQDAGCDENRKAFDQAKLLWMMDNGKTAADEVYFRDLLPDYIETPPICPRKGTYALNGLDGETTCTAHSFSGNPGRNTRL
jgi:prepilin-type N-terminal cleavage/methylation domain-containing protein